MSLKLSLPAFRTAAERRRARARSGDPNAAVLFADNQAISSTPTSTSKKDIAREISQDLTNRWSTSPLAISPDEIMQALLMTDCEFGLLFTRVNLPQIDYQILR